MDTILVSISPSEAAVIVTDLVVGSGGSAVCVGTYSNRSDAGQEVTMLVFEKYFIRVESRVSLSVVLENLGGITSVGSTGSGGGRGAVFANDWGSGQELSDLVREALAPYEAR